MGLTLMWILIHKALMVIEMVKRRWMQVATHNPSTVGKKVEDGGLVTKV